MYLYTPTMEMEKKQPMVTALQASEILGISRRHVVELIAAGHFPGAVKAWEGNRKAPWLIPAAELEKYRKEKAGKS